MGVRDKIQVFGGNYSTTNGTCVRDYICVSDLATAHVKALNYLAETHENLTANLGTVTGISVREIIEVALVRLQVEKCLMK